MTGLDESSFDEGRRERLRADLAARLGRRHVWFIDDPGMVEVLESVADLALLECIRAAGGPVPMARLVAMGHLDVATSSERIERLERLRLLEYVADVSGAGYRCVDSVITVVYDDSQEGQAGSLGRYRAGVRRYNLQVQAEVGAPSRHVQFFDRILQLTEEEMARLEVAIAKIAAEARRADEASAGRESGAEERRPVRLQLSTTHLDPGVDTLVPVYFMESSHPHNEAVMRSSLDRLTPRQQEVARLVVDGRTNPEIAVQLGISENTVKSSIREIFRRLDVDTRTDLVCTITG